MDNLDASETLTPELKEQYDNAMNYYQVAVLEETELRAIHKRFVDAMDDEFNNLQHTLMIYENELKTNMRILCTDNSERSSYQDILNYYVNKAEKYAKITGKYIETKKMNDYKVRVDEVKKKVEEMKSQSSAKLVILREECIKLKSRYPKQIPETIKDDELVNICKQIVTLLIKDIDEVVNNIKFSKKVMSQIEWRDRCLKYCTTFDLEVDPNDLDNVIKVAMEQYNNALLMEDEQKMNTEEKHTGKKYTLKFSGDIPDYSNPEEFNLDSRKYKGKIQAYYQYLNKPHSNYMYPVANTGYPEFQNYGDGDY